MRVRGLLLLQLVAALCLGPPGRLAQGAEQPLPADEAAAAPECDHERLRDLEVVDVHSHVFNFDYLPLEGIFYRFGVPWPVAGGLAALLHGATPTIDPSRDARATPSGGPPELTTLSSPQLAAAVQAQLRGHDPAAMDRLDRYRPRLLKALARHRLREASAQDPALRTDRPRRAAARRRVEAEYAPTSGLDLLVELVYQTLLRTEADPESLYSPAAAGRRSVDGALRAFKLLMSDEIEIVEQLKTDYPEVDLFVHHMMDLERVYRDRPPLPFKTQIEHAEWLGRRYGAELEFFVAFDPFRRDDQLVWDGVAAGARGAKFYPPSGYRPTDTELPPKPRLGIPITASCARRKQYRARYRGFGASEMDRLNLEFFRQAADRRLPIFSHHTPKGFQAGRSYGALLAEPCYWQRVFEKLPASANLTVILAHAGGADAWFGEDPESWESRFALQAYNLCVSYPNVYCDFGYPSAVLDEEARGRFVLRLKRLLARPVDPGRAPPTDLCEMKAEVAPRYPLGRKILYGTDWLVSVDYHRADYACRFHEAFEEEGLRRYMTDFFAGNAKRALATHDGNGHPR